MMKQFHSHCPEVHCQKRILESTTTAKFRGTEGEESN